jgi:hypothetical protein
MSASDPPSKEEAPLTPELREKFDKIDAAFSSGVAARFDEGIVGYEPMPVSADPIGEYLDKLDYQRREIEREIKEPSNADGIMRLLRAMHAAGRDTEEKGRYTHAINGLQKLPPYLRDDWYAILKNLHDTYEKLVSASNQMSAEETAGKLEDLQRTAERDWRILRPTDTEPPPADSTATIWFHGGQSYSIDGTTPKAVSREQHNALKMFLDTGQAITTRALENAGVSNVAKVMKKLDTAFPGAIRKPKKRGDGYYICVRNLTPTG